MDQNRDLFDSKRTGKYTNKSPDGVRRRLKHRAPIVQHEDRGPLYFWRQDFDRYLARGSLRAVLTVRSPSPTGQAMADDNWSFMPEQGAKVVRNGWRIVRQSQDKSTPIGWKQLQETSPTATQLRRWVHDFPNCLWAVAAGQASGVLELDFDVKDGGMPTLKRLG